MIKQFSVEITFNFIRMKLFAKFTFIKSDWLRDQCTKELLKRNKIKISNYVLKNRLASFILQIIFILENNYDFSFDYSSKQSCCLWICYKLNRKVILCSKIKLEKILLLGSFLIVGWKDRKLQNLYKDDWY
jgi:hypothetical protein